MKVAVVGLGLFGRSLAVNLARSGVEVWAVDSRMDLIDDIRDEVAVAVQLDATDERELRAQGIHETDVLVASIGDDFEANQLLVVLAKQVGIPRVIARAPSPKHARILKLIGADDVVMPEEQASEDCARRICQPSLKGYFELVEGYSVAEIQAPVSFDGKTLAELDLKTRYRINLVAIRRAATIPGAKPVINAVPLGSDQLRKGDVLAVAGRDEDIQKLMEAPPA
ncbi:MAG: TrkA family potassium uptake protein [Candidatus Brocadiae bacterium]|nr:TrkA family potassium uptake protein [Candidatus Brocadiia bacterium]